MQKQQREYISRVFQWVRALSFEQLVRAIYAQYPEMKENSVFRASFDNHRWGPMYRWCRYWV